LLGDEGLEQVNAEYRQQNSGIKKPYIHSSVFFTDIDQAGDGDPKKQYKGVDSIDPKSLHKSGSFLGFGQGKSSGIWSVLVFFQNIGNPKPNQHGTTRISKNDLKVGILCKKRHAKIGN